MEHADNQSLAVDGQSGISKVSTKTIIAIAIFEHDYAYSMAENVIQQSGFKRLSDQEVDSFLESFSKYMNVSKQELISFLEND